MFTSTEQPELLREKIVNVLAAEDEPLNRRVLEKQFGLYPAKYRLTTVNNGLEAVQAIEANNYHIILMDQKMPVMNGIEAVNRIRTLTDPAKKNIPIIIISASPVDERVCAELGVTFMLKPYKMAELFQNIEKAIAQSSSSDQTVSAVAETGFLPGFLQVQQVQQVQPAQLKEAQGSHGKPQDNPLLASAPKNKKRSCSIL